MVKRFRTEAKTTANIQHDNIITVYEIGEVEGQHFYSMQYIEGRTLSELLKASPLASHKAATLLKAVAEGVHFAHQANVLHRDLKPANIMIDANDRPYVMDFGLAKTTDESAYLTQTGTFLGSVAYVSPEQARDPASVTASGDVYSLGAILYAALVGKAPFVAEQPMEVLRQLQEADPVPPRKINPTIPRDLDTICLKCLEKIPGRRYTSAKALADDLELFLDNKPIRARRATVLEHGWRWMARNVAVSVLVGLSVLLLAGLLVANALNARHTNKIARDAKVEQLATIERSAVAGLIAQLREYDQSALLPEIKSRFSNAGNDSAKLRYALAMCHIDDDLHKFVTDYARSASPEEVELIRSRSIVPNPEIEAHWAVVNGSVSLPDHVLRSASVLAGLDPQNPNWQKIESRLIDILFDQNAYSANQWLNLLKPVLPTFEKSFATICTSEEQPERKPLAAAALSEIHEADPTALVGLIGQAEPGIFEVFFEKLKTSPQVDSLLDQAIKNNIRRDEPEPAEWANLCICRIRMGKLSIVDALSQTNDVVLRTMLSLRLGSCRSDILRIADALNQTEDDKISRHLICALGYYSDQNSKYRFQNGSKKKLANFLTHPNAGIRSAAEWVMRRWELPILSKGDSYRLNAAPRWSRNWYFTPHGHMMVAIRERSDYLPPIRKRLEDDPEPRGTPAFEFTPYAISAYEVTKQQYETFLDEAAPMAAEGKFLMPRIVFRHEKRFGPDDDSPANFVSFDLAASYCNWLSLKEGIPVDQWCFERVDNSMILVPDFHLKSGYRLPTEFEWENASGREFELIGNDEVARAVANLDYGTKPASIRVGQLMPNEMGLFDCYGNIYEWCIRDDDTQIKSQTLRGSSCFNDVELAGDPVRDLSSTSWAKRFYGFRIVCIFQPTEN